MLKTLPQKCCTQLIYIFLFTFFICLSSSINAQTITWTGAASSNWSNSANWSPQSVPDSNNNVIIPMGFIDYPVISGNAFAASININTGASLKMNANGMLTISNVGSLINAGSFISGAALVKFAGSGTVNGTIKFNSLTINGVVDVGNACTVKSILKLNANGALINHSVKYSDTSTLVYNTGIFTLTGKEWLPNSVPKNITITNSTLVALQSDRSLQGTLQISANSLLSLNNHALTLNGIIKGTGAIKGSKQSDLIINGSDAFGVLYFDETKDGTTNVLNNLIINRVLDTVTIADKLNLMGTYTPVAGVLNTKDTIVFKSYSTGTARVDAGAGNGGYFNGIAQVERFIPARRAWRWLTAPVVNDTLRIRTAWQEGVNNTDLNYADNKNPHPGYGTHISGNNDTLKGFDYNTQPNPSLKIWQQKNASWSAKAPATKYTLINKYPAYLIFVRGSRAVDLSQGTSAPPDSTKLRVTGFLNTGDIPQTLSGKPNTVIFLGNPYVSSVDLTKVLADATNISGGMKFWVWDSKLNSIGGYVVYDNGSITDANSYATADDAAILQSSGAFLVQISNSPASLTFHEADKTATQFNVFGKSSPQPELHVNLTQLSGDSLEDATTVQFNSAYSAAVDEFDAGKLYNFNENILLVRDDKTMAIELRPVPQASDTLFYRLYLRQNIDYTLQVHSKNLPASMKNAVLIDKYLHKQTPLKFNDTINYNFTPNTDTFSYRNRFIIVFTPTQAENEVDNNTAMQKANVNSSIYLYPNPVSGNKIQFQFNNIDKGLYDVSVYNVEGEEVLSKQIEHDGSNQLYTIPVSPTLPDGVYTLDAVSKSSPVNISSRFIIKHN